jgi:hypothetical protein
MTKLLASKMERGLRIQAIGALVLRYGLVLVIGWIGLMKLAFPRCRRYPDSSY